MKEYTWECRVCNMDEPCVLTIECEEDVTHAPEVCPFQSDMPPDWGEVKNQD